MTPILPPLPIFNDRDGSPLDAGYLYFGTVGLNPETDPVQVYWDEAGTQPAIQPIRTINGYASRNGAAALVYISASFSLTIKDKRLALVTYLRNATIGNDGLTLALASPADGQGAALVGASQAATYAAGTLGARFNQTPNVKDAPYSATGGGVANELAAFNAAFAAGKMTFIPGGSYNLSATPTIGSSAAWVAPNATFSGAGAPRGLPDFKREFWPDTAAGANVWRFQDRLFVGLPTTGNRLGPQNALFTTLTEGAAYLTRDATILGFSAHGQIGVVGFSRSSDTPYPAYSDCMGISGATINDRLDGKAWSCYLDVQHTGAEATSYGFETALKNGSGLSRKYTPYGLEGASPGGGVIGWQCFAGGDPAYGPAPSGTISCGINFVSNNNATALACGINFGKDAIVGNDGLGAGDGDAIMFATGHRMKWLGAFNRTIASIWAQSVTASQSVHQKFLPSACEFQNHSETTAFRINAQVGTLVNYIQVAGATTTGAPVTSVTGTDANVSHTFTTKGVGNYTFGFNASGATPVFQMNPVASGVNYLGVAGSATGGNPNMTASGTDANPSILLIGKGTGGVILRDGGGANKISVNTTGIGEFGAAPVARPTYGAPTGTATRTTFDTTTVTTQQLAERVKAMIDDSRSRGSYA